MTEIRLLSGWFPGNRKGNKRGKDQNTPPLRGVEGVQRKREKSKFLWRVPILVHFIWKIEIKLLSLPKNKDYGSIEFYIKRISEPAGSRV